MKCTCNAFESDLIGLFNDFTRTLGEPVDFPAPPVIEEDDEITALPDNSYIIEQSKDGTLITSTRQRVSSQTVTSAVTPSEASTDSTSVKELSLIHI